MPRIVRTRTLDDLEAAQDAALILRDALAEADPDRLANSPGQGCCGCGSLMADVRTDGEGYCWACVDRMGIDEYIVLPGRGR